MDVGSNRAVCILGMHRSGTSMVSRSLNLLGVNLGEKNKLVGQGKHNQKGFWEYRKITRTQESLLKELGYNWFTPKPLPKKWWERNKVKPYITELKTIVEKDFKGTNLWGWKDPRNSLTLPLWKKLLSKLNMDASYVIVVRNPLEVAASLKTRNKFTYDHSFKLWGLYTLSALLGTFKEKRVIVMYEDFLSDWEKELKVISERLNIPWPEDEEWLKNSMEEFITKDLHHNKSSLQELERNNSVPEWVVEIYKLIQQGKASDFVDSDQFTLELVSIFVQYFFK